MTKRKGENKKRLTKRCQEVDVGKKTRGTFVVGEEMKNFLERNAGEHQSMQLAKSPIELPSYAIIQCEEFPLFLSV